MWCSTFDSLNTSLLFSVQNIKMCAHKPEININMDVILSGYISFWSKSPELARFNLAATLCTQLHMILLINGEI